MELHEEELTRRDDGYLYQVERSPNETINVVAKAGA